MKKQNELPQDLLDICYTVLDTSFHEKIHRLFLEGEEEKREYQEYYHGMQWEKRQHATDGSA